jgi:hypothetical protein
VGKSVAKIEGISPSRPIENASRELAMSDIKTVFAVANIAIAPSTLGPPGHVPRMARASGASLDANSLGVARAMTANDTNT